MARQGAERRAREDAVVGRARRHRGAPARRLRELVLSRTRGRTNTVSARAHPNTTICIAPSRYGHKYSPSTVSDHRALPPNN
jgi:hypothetical protein